MGQLKITTGGSTEAIVKQTSKIINSLSVHAKKKIAANTRLSSTLSAESMVSMKADLGIPWEKMIKMARYKLKIIIENSYSISMYK